MRRLDLKEEEFKSLKEYIALTKSAYKDAYFDKDKDGLNNIEEYKKGLNPLLKDSKAILNICFHSLLGSLTEKGWLN